MASIFSPGIQLDHFRLEAEVGWGGMGVVYRATDLVLSRPVALKLLAPYLGGDEAALLRFHREAAAAANLRHAHIATVYEFGEHEGQPYIAFEWIEGCTLRDLLAVEGRLPLDRALRLFDQLASALDYAHQRGVIHRDIKSSNIMVGAGDHATIVDFGLAWQATAPAITVHASLFGTPRYMSPEQIWGEPVDGRSDLYSLAIVLYEMLAGQPPFDDPATPTVLHHQLYTPPPPITEINPDLPAAVETALLKALAKKPAERFPTATAFGAALRAPMAFQSPTSTPQPSTAPAGLPQPIAPLAVEPTDTQPPVLLPAAMAGDPARVRQPSRRRWWFKGRTVLLGVLVVLGVLSLWRQIVTPTAGTPDMLDSTAVATQATLPVSEQEPAPTPITPVPLNVPNESGWWSMAAGGPAQTGLVGEGLGPLNPEPHWRRNPRSAGGTALIAGGGMVIFGVDGGSVRALDWATGQPAWETEPLGANVAGTLALGWTDNSLVVFVTTDDGGLHALSFYDGKLIWNKTPQALQGTLPGGVTVGNDSTVYAATDSGWLHALNPTTGEPHWSLDLTTTDTFHLAPAITGAAIFLSGNDQAVYAIDPITLETAWSAETVGIPRTSPCVAESLGIVFVGTDQGWVHAFSMILGRPIWSQRASSAIVGLATDGWRVFGTVADGNVYAWNGWGGDVPLWVLNMGSPLTTAPLTDGTHVLIGTTAGEVRYIHADSGQEVLERRLVLNEPIYYTPAPAGGWLFIRGTNIYAISPP